jgi:hypothetical protein
MSVECVGGAAWREEFVRFLWTVDLMVVVE